MFLKFQQIFLQILKIFRSNYFKEIQFEQKIEFKFWENYFQISANFFSNFENISFKF